MTITQEQAETAKAELCLEAAQDAHAKYKRNYELVNQFVKKESITRGMKALAKIAAKNFGEMLENQEILVENYYEWISVCNLSVEEIERDSKLFSQEYIDQLSGQTEDMEERA